MPCLILFRHLGCTCEVTTATYKKGDLWKAAILMLLIRTVLWYSFRTVLRSARLAGASSIATRTGTQPSGQRAAGTASEMFAPRAQGVGQLLDQRGVVLTKGRERASLQLQKEPAPTSR